MLIISAFVGRIGGTHAGGEDRKSSTESRLSLKSSSRSNTGGGIKESGYVI